MFAAVDAFVNKSGLNNRFGGHADHTFAGASGLVLVALRSVDAGLHPRNKRVV